MREKRTPHQERTPGDYMNAADDAMELAKVLAGQGAISDQDFLQRMARSDDTRRSRIGAGNPDRPLLRGRSLVALSLA